MLLTFPHIERNGEHRLLLTLDGVSSLMLKPVYDTVHLAQQYLWSVQRETTDLLLWDPHLNN